MRPHVADMPEVDFQQGALSVPRAFPDLRHSLVVCFLHATVRSQPLTSTCCVLWLWLDLLQMALAAAHDAPIAPVPMRTIPLATRIDK